MAANSPQGAPAKITVPTLSKYMELGLNIYIFGEAGTGKTQLLMAAARDRGYELGYMSAPTLDAYVDLVGIPIAEKDKVRKKKILKFIRKQDFENIEVLFIDELPRGELKTLNAIFELVQMGTINGEKAMPKLKCVVAAGNPMTNDYQGQQELDLALLDRFDMYLQTSTVADKAYFANVFGTDFGAALTDWHKAHDHDAKGYLSPRRLEKIGHTWRKIPTVATIKAMVPPGGTFAVDDLQRRLLKASQGDSAMVVDASGPLIQKIAFMSDDEVRKARTEITDLLPTLDRSEMAQLTERVASALQTGIRIDTIIRDWGPVLEYFSAADRTMLLKKRTADANSEFLKKAAAAQLSIGKNLKDFS